MTASVSQRCCDNNEQEERDVPRTSDFRRRYLTVDPVSAIVRKKNKEGDVPLNVYPHMIERQNTHQQIHGIRKRKRMYQQSPILPPHQQPSAHWK
jgi:hypothetical protein